MRSSFGVHNRRFKSGSPKKIAPSEGVKAPDRPYFPKYVVPDEPRTILERYQRDRDQAETPAERHRVWRTYAWAVVETFAERPLVSITVDVRRARSGGDDELPVRFPRYWRALSDDDLRELWVALERARYAP